MGSNLLTCHVFSNLFTNGGTRLYQDAPTISSPPFLDRIMNHLGEHYLGKQGRIKLIVGGVHPAHRTLGSAAHEHLLPARAGLSHGGAAEER